MSSLFVLEVLERVCEVKGDAVATKRVLSGPARAGGWIVGAVTVEALSEL